jgi:dihydrofolate reductase
MKLSIVVAVDRNNVIGKDNKLIWHLPADLRHFKRLTMGNYMIMGRKTYESIGKALPGRVSVVVTRQNLDLEDCIVVHSVEEALALVPPDREVNVIGGAEIFRQTLPFTSVIHLTTIHHAFEGDTFFPALDPKEWKTVWEEYHEADEKNPYPFTFSTLERK